MSAPALIIALALLTGDVPAPAAPPQGEPLPADAPTQDYPLTAWCYGAMSEYLAIYDRVKPDLKAIDKMFGTSEPNEPEPYASDMAAAHKELKVIADAVTEAEKASPNPIAAQGAEAVKQGRSIWAPAEAKTSRELARAWLSWALPDRCDSTARALASKSALLGQALKYNTPPDAQEAPPAPPTPTPASDAPVTPPAETAPVPPPSSEPAAPPPAASDSTPGGQAPAEAAPSSPPVPGPRAQTDPNGPIPDPTPPKS
jgi:hypothetical protein